MRLLLVGAFAYPHDQGSQVYFQEQAIALRAAGAEIHLQTYGPGKTPRNADGRVEVPASADADRRRALAGFPHTGLPGWAAPGSRRSGPHSGKPLADLALALALWKKLRASGLEPGATAAEPGGAPKAADQGSIRASGLASIRASSDAPVGASIQPSAAAAFQDAPNEASRSTRPRGAAQFDVILAHHAEAALLALSLPRPRPPIVYCAHTLLEEELPKYFERLRSQGFLASVGRGIDHRVARWCDGWIALTQASNRVMSRVNERPGRRIAPPIADPQLDPDRPDSEKVARAHGLVPGGFFLYAGNLDPYQDLPLLERIARARGSQESARQGSGGACERRLPLVIATHDDRASGLAARIAAAGGCDLRVCQLRSTGEGQALVAAARANLVPRRTVGGFPIKLANSLAAGVPVIAFHADEWGIEDGRDSLIGELAAPVTSFARALERLEHDPALAARLGAGARATYLAQHSPDQVAVATLALIETVLSRR